MNDTPRTDEKIEQIRGDCKIFIHDEIYIAGDFARQLERELTTVTEQRDEARKLAEKYRYLSCDSQEEADAEVLPWENNQPTEP